MPRLPRRPISPIIRGTSRASMASASISSRIFPRYLTAFARFGWDNGKTESFAYTEVDQTFDQRARSERRVVASQAGPRRHRLRHQRHQERSPELSRRRRPWLPSRRRPSHYGRENILESYYTVHVWRGIYLAPGVQHIINPGYNRDRGPVIVPSFRAHVEF